MGYEIKMFVGRKGSLLGNENGNQFFRVDAELDLCKIGSDNPLSEYIDKAFVKAKEEKEGIYLYGLDGNQKFTKDCYGDKLPLCPIEEVYKVVKKTAQKDNYRRFKWAEALLASMKDDPEGLSVVFYGH